MKEDFTAPHAFCLGQAAVYPSHNLIRLGDDTQTVEPRVMAVLCFLVAHEGQVLSRKAIIDAVWGVAHGGDESLTRAISLLRKALRQQDGDEVIRTIPKRGYSLVGEVTKAPALERPTSDQSRGPRRANRRWAGWLAALIGLVLAITAVVTLQRAPPPSQVDGVVVLVKPLGGDEDASRTRILTDELTAALARFDQIKVRRSDQSARPDPQRAYVYVVTGLAKTVGQASELRVQLHDFSTGDALWSGAERFAGHDDQAAAVSTLSAQLERAVMQAAKRSVQAKPVMSLSPWELVLLGTWVPGADQEWPGPPTKDSYWVWERAISKDPDYALAFASLAQVMANFALFNPPSDTPAQAARAAAHADHALRLAPYDAGVVYQVALYKKYAGERDQSAAAFQRVLDLEPDNLMARIELRFVTGQCTSDSAEAIADLKALDASLPAADPAHWVILSRMADMALARGDYVQARAYAGRSRQIVRQVWSSITLAAADAQLGQAAQARAIGLEHQGQWPALDYGRFAQGPLSRWCLGGDAAKAREAFEKLDALTRPRTAATTSH
ncbi:winged helix-turn-helix domain-containing protein [Caulobacter sp. UNC358MFTsu5.1]|uniref:winged helix-turn-helix domain-containing protein n=1 Tax=Caulobacter sp. UNC358MFTsu5.1 TaxID=1449049 RepID=UPI0004A6CC3C|nr:winged helix-turn-helix domain-containing protein [Caulobacter sp. UNC358MFTsu5.1]